MQQFHLPVVFTSAYNYVLKRQYARLKLMSLNLVLSGILPEQQRNSIAGDRNL